MTEPDGGDATTTVSDTMQNLELSVPVDQTAPASARRWLVECGVVGSNRLSDVLLLTSELVTNAVKHGSSYGSGIDLRVRSEPGLLRVEVEADGASFTPPADEDLVVPGSGGMGLRLLRSLADRWDVEPASSTNMRTVVWFELSHP